MPKGLFELTVMYFGLHNSPGTFMRMMQFRDMIWQWKCAIYMDDLIFKGKTKEELQRNTLEGLEILAKHDLYVEKGSPAHYYIVVRKWLTESEKSLWGSQG